jgi:hypothetical protein
MAQKIQVLLVDDIDGSDASETVSFGIDGNSYEIDLTEENASKLRAAVALYVAHARRAGRSAPPSSAVRKLGRPAGRTDIQAIREWARENGQQVSDRGRIPGSIMDAYDQAH